MSKHLKCDYTDSLLTHEYFYTIFCVLIQQTDILYTLPKLRCTFKIGKSPNPKLSQMTGRPHDRKNQEDIPNTEQLIT